MGDGISTDQNKHSNTHIRTIIFNPINLRFTNKLVCN